MNSPAPAPAPAAAESVSFAFVRKLASELSAGKIDLPSFPDIAMRVRKVLQDEEVSPDKVTRVVGAEPALAARILQIANSAAVNSSGRKVTDLRMAVARIGFNLVRSTAISFAMSQLTRSAELKGLEKPLRELWQRSALVAAMGYVVAKRLTTVNPDIALLAGMLHGVGKLYILVRAAGMPQLFADPAAYQRIEQMWHANIAKAVLENWEISEEVVAAVHQQEDLEYSHEGATDLTDVLLLSNLLVSYREHPESIELNMQGVKPASRMRVDVDGFRNLLVDSRAEIDALRSALA